LIGFPATRISGHYYVLITLGFGEIVRLILMNWKEVTNERMVSTTSRSQDWVRFSLIPEFLLYLVMFFLVLTICSPSATETQVRAFRIGSKS